MESLKERNASSENKNHLNAPSTIMLTLNSKLSIYDAKIIDKYQRWIKV